LVRLGELLNLTGHPADALDILADAQAALSRLAVPPAYDLLKCEEYTALAMRELGRLTEAASLFERVAAAYGDLLGDGSLDQLLALNQLGQCEHLRGNYIRAEELWLFSPIRGCLEKAYVTARRSLSTVPAA
jgi:hypothetical protein